MTAVVCPAFDVAGARNGGRGQALGTPTRRTGSIQPGYRRTSDRPTQVRSERAWLSPGMVLWRDQAVLDLDPFVESKIGVLAIPKNPRDGLHPRREINSERHLVQIKIIFVDGSRGYDRSCEQWGWIEMSLCGSRGPVNSECGEVRKAQSGRSLFGHEPLTVPQMKPMTPNCFVLIPRFASRVPKHSINGRSSASGLFGIRS